jgi:predicted  nucleic acid-binding Zn-ribbon protein
VSDFLVFSSLRLKFDLRRYAETRMEGERSAAEAGMQRAIESLTSRNDELDERARELMEAKYKLDSKISDVSSKLNASDSELTVGLYKLNQVDP